MRSSFFGRENVCNYWYSCWIEIFMFSFSCAGSIRRYHSTPFGWSLGLISPDPAADQMRKLHSRSWRLLLGQIRFLIFLWLWLFVRWLQFTLRFSSRQLSSRALSLIALFGCLTSTQRVKGPSQLWLGPCSTACSSIIVGLMVSRIQNLLFLIWLACHNDWILVLNVVTIILIAAVLLGELTALNSLAVVCLCRNHTTVMLMASDNWVLKSANCAATEHFWSLLSKLGWVFFEREHAAAVVNPARNILRLFGAATVVFWTSVSAGVVVEAGCCSKRIHFGFGLGRFLTAMVYWRVNRGELFYLVWSLLLAGRQAGIRFLLDHVESILHIMLHDLHVH